VFGNENDDRLDKLWQSAECRDDAVNVVTDVVERSEHAHVGTVADFFERYRKHDCALHAHVRVCYSSETGQRHAGDFCAIFERQIGRELAFNFARRTGNTDGVTLDFLSDDDQESVLIGIVEFRHRPEGIVLVGDSSFVWLQTVDECRSVGGNIGFKPTSDVGVVLSGGKPFPTLIAPFPDNWEGTVERWWFMRAADHGLVHQVFKDGPQLVNSFANQDSQWQRECRWSSAQIESPLRDSSRLYVFMHPNRVFGSVRLRRFGRCHA
jgi:hypothetical protein